MGTMFEQLKANKLPINHVWKLGLDVEKKKRYWTVFLAAESVPWLRMTDWAWLSDQTTQPWHTHTHKINLRRSLFCLVKERKKPAPAYITRYPGNGGDETISRFWLVKLELLKPCIHNSRLIMSCAPECSSWGFVEPLEYFYLPGCHGWEQTALLWETEMWRFHLNDNGVNNYWERIWSFL